MINGVSAGSLIPAVMFTQQPSNLSLVQSANATLSCSAIGSPAPNITWRRSSGSGLPYLATIVAYGNLTVGHIPMSTFHYFATYIHFTRPHHLFPDHHQYTLHCEHTAPRWWPVPMSGHCTWYHTSVVTASLHTGPAASHTM